MLSQDGPDPETVTALGWRAEKALLRVESILKIMSRATVQVKNETETSLDDADNGPFEALHYVSTWLEVWSKSIEPVYRKADMVKTPILNTLKIDRPKELVDMGDHARKCCRILFLYCIDLTEPSTKVDTLHLVHSCT